MLDVTYYIAKDIQTKLSYLQDLKADVESTTPTIVQLLQPLPAPAALAAGTLKDFLIGQATVFIDDQITAAETDFENLQDAP